MKTVALSTLGCKVNQYETEAISEMFEDNGYIVVPFSDKADYYIINTCSVTAMSDKKSRQIIRRAKKTNPQAVVAVMGCYSQTAPDEVLDIDGVNLVLGTKDKKSVVKLISGIDNTFKLNAVTDVRDNHIYEDLSVKRCTDRTRAYIKIQDGCSQFCSYCIIPYARGPVRSRAEAEVTDEVTALAKNGYREVILTGIHAASYGRDLGNTNLAQLLNKIDTIDGIERVRLSSIEPMTLNREFVDNIRNCRKLCPHFHISLQSGCDETLKRMNRHYTTNEFYEVVAGLREAFSDCAITTDIMVGFQGETEEEFRTTLDFVNKVQFSEAHVFQYSPRRGTPAAKRPNQISPQIKEERSKIIIEATTNSKNEFLKSHIGRDMQVLFETRTKDNYYEGKTSNYITVYVPCDDEIGGEFKNVRMLNMKDGILYGEIIADGGYNG